MRMHHRQTDPVDGTKEFTEGIKSAVTTLIGIAGSKIRWICAALAIAIPAVAPGPDVESKK